MKKLNIIGLICWIILGGVNFFADDISKFSYFAAWFIALIYFIVPLIENEDGDND